MHIFTTCDTNPQALQTFTCWLDAKQILWTRSGSEIRIFNLTDDLTGKVESCAGACFDAFTLSCAPASAPVPAPAHATDTLTWYQFTAILAATTGQVYRLGELDTPVRWSMDLDEGIFLFQVKRVSFKETVRRYNVTGTELVYTKVSQEEKKWVTDEVRLPLEKAGDLVKFGGVNTPEQYWQRRIDAAAHLDWSTPALARVLERKIAIDSALSKNR